MRKTIVALLMCLACMGMQAQVFNTSSRHLPAPSLLPPLMSTASPQKSSLQVRTAEPRSIKPQTPKPVVVREQEPSYKTTQHYIGLGYLFSDFNLAKDPSGPGLTYGFMHTFAGSSQKAFAPYWGAEVGCAYTGDMSFTLQASPQVGIMLGKSSLRFDFRVQAGYVYLTEYAAYIGYDYDNDIPEIDYVDDGGLYIGCGAGVSFNKIMIGARLFGAVAGDLYELHESLFYGIMLGMRL